MSSAPMVELGLFEFRARCRIQTESLIGKYRTWKDRPNDMTCQPWRIVIACLWMAAVIPAVGDRTSRWFTDGNAGVKLSPVDRAMSRSKRWLFVLVALLVAVLGSGIGVAFDLSGWTLGLLVVTVLLFFGIDLLTPTFTVHHSDSFYTNIDFYSTDLARYRTSQEGSGLDLLQHLRALADAERLTVGATAQSVELRDKFYLPNGLVADCGPDEDAALCLSVVYVPTATVSS